MPEIQKGESYQFVVLISFKATSLEDAYRQLRKQLPHYLSYETTDEAYCEEKAISLEELNLVRSKVLSEVEAKPVRAGRCSRKDGRA